MPNPAFKRDALCAPLNLTLVHSTPMKILPTIWSEFLVKKPETGMGYQVVSVTLRDGRKIQDVAIIQSSIIGEVRGYADVPFESDDITNLELTHRKWEFKR
jgi:hypothetical protein